MTLGKKIQVRGRRHRPTAIHPENPAIAQFEQKLKESEEQFRSLAEQPLAGTYIIQDDILKYVNRRFAEMFGYPQGEITGGMRLQDLVVPEDRQAVEASIRQCASHRLQPIRTEFRGLKRTGSTIHAEMSASPAMHRGRPALMGIMLDVTEKTELEQQLQQAQKMEAVGQLTSGIAHDFNNILTVIVGCATALENKIKPDDPARNYAVQILTIAEQAAKVIQGLLSFSRKQSADLRAIDINDAVRRAEKIVRWVIDKRIAVRVSAATDDLIVHADAGQIEQVMVNLATNASDAMPHGGTLTIETGIADSAVRDDTAEPMYGKYAVISVSDTGVGMHEETRGKIFEPFFTTKEPGRGTGLGLSMVHRIIRRHKGYIRCDSQPGEGARFRIYLPLLPASGKTDETGCEALPPAGENRQCSETKLIAGNDCAARTSAKTNLEACGGSRSGSV